MAFYNIHGERFLLNPRIAKAYKKFGPFPSWYQKIKDAEIKKSGDVFIVCPGTSLDDIDVDRLRGRDTIAVNLAGFLTDGYWLVAETRVSVWLSANFFKLVNDFDPSREAIMTPRAAVWHRWQELRRKKARKGPSIFGRIYLTPYWEDELIAQKVTASGLVSAMWSARFLGYDRIILVGVDTMYQNGVRYTKKVPEMKVKIRGRVRVDSYEKQAGEITDAAKVIFGKNVVNTSPVSRDILPFEYIPYERML